MDGFKKLPLFPSPSNFMNESDFRIACLEWEEEVEKEIDFRFLPVPVSSSYHRITDAKEIVESKTCKIGSEQIEELNEIVLGETKISKDLEFSTAYRRKNTRISHWLMLENPWNSFLIQKMPEPRFFDSFSAFKAALISWYNERPTDIPPKSKPYHPKELKQFLSPVEEKKVYSPIPGKKVVIDKSLFNFIISKRATKPEKICLELPSDFVSSAVEYGPSSAHKMYNIPKESQIKKSSFTLTKFFLCCQMKDKYIDSVAYDIVCFFLNALFKNDSSTIAIIFNRTMCLSFLLKCCQRFAIKPICLVPDFPPKFQKDDDINKNGIIMHGYTLITTFHMSNLLCSFIIDTNYPKLSETLSMNLNFVNDSLSMYIDLYGKQLSEWLENVTEENVDSITTVLRICIRYEVTSVRSLLNSFKHKMIDILNVINNFSPKSFSLIVLDIFSYSQALFFWLEAFSKYIITVDVILSRDVMQFIENIFDIDPSMNKPAKALNNMLYDWVFPQITQLLQLSIKTGESGYARIVYKICSFIGHLESKGIKICNTNTFVTDYFYSFIFSMLCENMLNRESEVYVVVGLSKFAGRSDFRTYFKKNCQSIFKSIFGSKNKEFDNLYAAYTKLFRVYFIGAMRANTHTDEYDALSSVFKVLCQYGNVNPKTGSEFMKLIRTAIVEFVPKDPPGEKKFSLYSLPSKIIFMLTMLQENGLQPRFIASKLVSSTLYKKHAIALDSALRLRFTCLAAVTKLGTDQTVLVSFSKKKN